MEKTLLEIGDEIEIKNWYNTMTVKIARVTATKATSEPYNTAGVCFEFQRKLWYDNNVRLFARNADRGSVTERKLIKK